MAECRVNEVWPCKESLPVGVKGLLVSLCQCINFTKVDRLKLYLEGGVYVYASWYVHMYLATCSSALGDVV